MPATDALTAIGTAFASSLLTYLKVNSDRKATGNERETQFALMEKRIVDCETKMTDLCEMKKSIERINISLARIETILELYLKGEKT